jgi:hypothetical protein
MDLRFKLIPKIELRRCYFGSGSSRSPGGPYAPKKNTKKSRIKTMVRRIELFFIRDTFLQIGGTPHTVCSSLQLRRTDLYLSPKSWKGVVFQPSNRE